MTGNSKAMVESRNGTGTGNRMKKDQQSLRTKEMGDALDCSPEDVYEAILRGEVPATKKGKYWLLHYEDVIAYNERRKRRRETR